MTWNYLQALLLTIAIEVPVVAIVFSGQRKRLALVALLATTSTHLTMHFVLPLFLPTSQSVIWAGEFMALGVEAIVYWLLSRPRDLALAFIASSLANTASFAAGFLL